MHPWLLAEIRKEDLAARYKTAERSRLAAAFKSDPSRASADPDESVLQTSLRRSGRNSIARRATGLAIGALLIALLVAMSACASPPGQAEPTASNAQASVPDAVRTDVPAAAATGLAVIHSDTAIAAPESVPAGVRLVTVQNNGSDWHASIFRRLNDDVTMEQFTAAFQENPFGSLPLTTQLGGPDLAPGQSAQVVLNLLPGQYVVVDNWVEPPRFVPFTAVDQAVADDAPPQAAVAVEMREHEFIMTLKIQAGRQWWQFSNTGAAPHQVGIIKLLAGKTLDDVAAWLDSEEGPPPWKDVAFWNVMSPGQQSWGEMDLPAGAYLALDFLPDFNNDGAPNFSLGMVAELTVVE
jgi:hypothetical protein